MLKRTVTYLIPSLLLPVLAATFTAAANDEHLRLPEVKSVAQIPGTFNMIEDGTGRVIIVSENTRYVFKSFELIDTWHDNTKITTTQQMNQLSSRLQPSMIPLDMMLTVRLTGDTSKPSLIAYVDPDEESSKAFIREAISSRIPTHLVIVPFRGDNDSDKSRRLSCAVQAGQLHEAHAAVTTDDYKALSIACKEHQALRANVVTARTIGVTGTPFVVSADGRMFRGLPPDLLMFSKASK